MVTVGGKHAIFNLMQTVIGEGDEVIIPVPYWVTYKDVVNYAGGKCVFVPSDEDSGFTFTAEMIAPYITPRSKLLIINSPNNPTGTVYSAEVLRRLDGIIPDSMLVISEDLRDDRLADRFLPRAQASHRRHDEAPESHHVESHVNFAEGGH